MSESNTSPLTVISTAGDIVIEAKDTVSIAANKVDEKLDNLHVSQKVSAAKSWVADKVVWIKSLLGNLNRETVLIGLGILAALILGFMLVSKWYDAGTPKNEATKKIESTMSSMSVEILDESSLDLVNDYRSSKMALPLERSRWLDDEAVRLAKEMTELKADVKTKPLTMSEQVATKFSEVTRVLAVGQASFDKVLTDWSKDQNLVKIITSGRYDLAGLAYVGDSNSHWKHHWVIVLAKSKTERS